MLHGNAYKNEELYGDLCIITICLAMLLV